MVLIIIGGLILLLIPGFIFALWYFFVPSIVVIEGLYGRAALKRSRELGKGNYLRILGYLIVVELILLLLMIAIIGAVFASLSGSFEANLQLFQLVTDLATSLALQPLILVSIVLLYYDMRARKEGYSATQLSEEFRV